ncbi:MAG: hypothetical protein D3903_22030, partial [Candidatus Electrothrix sp. GM3_4]|nr:hypothetical protein [Candidatus Electrothrix sp. GM3_4]
MEKVIFGHHSANNTTVIGDLESDFISKVYVDSNKQQAPNEFQYLFNQFGFINSIKNSDYQEGIEE